MKHKLFLLMLPLLAVLFTACPSDPVDTTGSISGIIRDALNSNPLQGAIVTLSPSGQSTTTGTDGRYQFSNVEMGDYEVNVARTDYKPDSKRTTVQVGQNSVVDFVLGRANSSLEVTPKTLDFGKTNTNLNINIKNAGQATMTWEITENESWFSCSETKGTVLAGQTGSVVVTVDRSRLEQGNYENTLVITSNDGGSETIYVKMAVDIDKLVPTVSMIGVNPTDISATLTGSLISIGSSSVASHGFYWTTNPNMPVEDVISDLSNPESKNRVNLLRANEPKEFTYSLSGLTASTVYYVYAYAINDIGVGVSSRKSFSTLSTQGPPTVETGEASQILSNSASVAGNITDLGCTEGVTKYGHVWSNVSSVPNINDNEKTDLGTKKQVGSFTSSLTNLKPNTLYYVRAYAINKYNTSDPTYGKVIQFTTQYAPAVLTTKSVTSITHNEATSGGSITDKGGHTITERGVCWGTNINPTYEDNSHSASTNNTDNFSVRLTNLSETTSYHARAYVKTGTGKIYYGQDVPFTTTHEIVMPQTSATTVSEVGSTTVKLSGIVIDNGKGTIRDAGFCYSTSSNPTTSNYKKSCGSVTSSFTATLTNLNFNTHYYVRAYVTNECGTAYGEQAEFTTLDITIPTLTAVTVSSITHKSAKFTAKVTSLGNGTVKRSGFCYSTSHTPVANNTVNAVIECGKVKDLSATASSLSVETTYYVRAFVENEKGIAYSEEQTFTTLEGNSILREDWENDENWN